LSFLHYVFIAAQKSNVGFGSNLAARMASRQPFMYGRLLVLSPTEPRPRRSHLPPSNPLGIMREKVLTDCDAEFVEFVKTMGLFLSRLLKNLAGPAISVML
jgi:hypothetical protein